MISRLVALALLMLWGVAEARDPVTVRDIRIEGIQRIEAGTVFSYLPIRAGDVLDGDRSDQALKALFDTGFF